MIRALFRSWGLGNGGTPKPWPTPVPQRPPAPPKPSKLAAVEETVLRVMFATPIPVAWDGEGIK